MSARDQGFAPRPIFPLKAARGVRFCRGFNHDAHVSAVSLAAHIRRRTSVFRYRVVRLRRYATSDSSSTKSCRTRITLGGKHDSRNPDDSA
jgi:hypothetical protein